MTRRTLWIVLPLAALLAGPLSVAHADDVQKPAEATTLPPADSPLAKVKSGMDEGKVTEILGNPHMQNSWRTGKSRIPFYKGSDSRRQLWQYQGIGTVTFSKGRYSAYKVIEVVHNPDQLAGVDVQPQVVEGANPVIVPPVRRPPGVHVPGLRPRIPRPRRW